MFSQRHGTLSNCPGGFPHPKHEKSTHFPCLCKLIPGSAGSSSLPGFQADVKHDGRRRRQVQNRRVTAVKAQGGDKTVIVISQAKPRLEHLASRQIPARLPEHAPAPVQDKGGVQVDLLLLAKRRIGTIRRQLQIAQFHRRQAKPARDVDLVLPNGGVSRIEAELMR